jgi:hypothetical protein
MIQSSLSAIEHHAQGDVFSRICEYMPVILMARELERNTR